MDTQPQNARDYRSLVASVRTAASVKDACLSLRTAMTLATSFQDWMHAFKTLSRLPQEAVSELVGKRIRVALLGSSSTVYLAPMMKAMGFSAGFTVELYEGDFAQLEQEIFRPDSGLHAFNPQVVILLMHWRDAGTAWQSAESMALCVEQNHKRWGALLDRGYTVVQTSFDAPSVESAGYAAWAQEGGRTRGLTALNLRLLESAPKGVYLLDTMAMAYRVGATLWDDYELWAMARQHPHPNAQPVLSQRLVAMIQAIGGWSRKILVVDLDHTLWGGVIGEDGLEGIKIGAPSPTGELFAVFQDYLLELKQRGVVLAVCSKNNPEDARLPFEKHSGMRLRVEDFAVFDAGWSPKADRLVAMSKTLGLGLESFVFVDDNPVECEAVEQALPQVRVLRMGETPIGVMREIDGLGLFETTGLSQEDRLRAQSYADNAQREAYKSTASSVEDFLRGLSMRARCVALEPSRMQRVEQLINKTNQFNLTLRRRTMGELNQLSQEASTWTQSVELSDKFGDNGLVGVMFAERGEVSWRVDTWLMSCRVIGRGLEFAMFGLLVKAARAAGAKTLEATYVVGPKNVLVSNLYSSLGFALVSETYQEKHYRLDLGVACVPEHFIEIVA